MLVFLVSHLAEAAPAQLVGGKIKVLKLPKPGYDVYVAKKKRTGHNQDTQGSSSTQLISSSC